MTKPLELRLGLHLLILVMDVNYSAPTLREACVIAHLIQRVRWDEMFMLAKS